MTMKYLHVDQIQTKYFFKLTSTGFKFKKIFCSRVSSFGIDFNYNLFGWGNVCTHQFTYARLPTQVGIKLQHMCCNYDEIFIVNMNGFILEWNTEWDKNTRSSTRELKFTRFRKLSISLFKSPLYITDHDMEFSFYDFF